MEILIEDLQKKLSLDLVYIKKIVRRILKRENIESATLSVVFVSAQKIRAMNIKFKKRAYVTDVLAFDMGDDMDPESEQIEIIGDIVISTDAAIQNAREYGTSVAQELSLYVIHGILHLLGYDDHEKSDTEKMRSKEQELLAFLGKKADKVLSHPVK